MRTVKLVIKVAAVALMLYVFMLQRKDYYHELVGKPSAATPATLPAKAK